MLNNFNRAFCSAIIAEYIMSYSVVASCPLEKTHNVIKWLRRLICGFGSMLHQFTPTHKNTQRDVEDNGKRCELHTDRSLTSQDFMIG